MILGLVGSALAGSCCTTVGAQPTVLGSCEALGVALGAGGDVEYGGWAWNGAWSPVGDDGGGNAVLSVAIMGRLAPWLQGGVRLPVNLAVDRLDGETSSELGLGNGLLWLDLETPAGWPGPRAPHLALDLGLGTEGPSAMSPGAKVVQVAARASRETGQWSAWGTVTGRVPVLGAGVVDGEASFLLDHSAGAKARAGFGAGLLAAAEAMPSWSVSLGPSFTLAPNGSDRVALTARAGLPVGHLGQNTASRFTLSLDWYRVLSHVRT